MCNALPLQVQALAEGDLADDPAGRGKPLDSNNHGES